MDLSKLTRRRDFLLNLAMGLTLVPGFALAAGYVTRYLVPTGTRRTEEILLTRLDDVPIGQSRLFNDVLGNDIVAVRVAGRDVKAFSSTCTHLGCRVGWDAAQSNFLCPCHVGRFDTGGNVISGPPPAPLTRFQVRIDRDQVLVTVPVKEA
ncbi:MAG: QcrA and Rieske domain-containing protein [Thermoanaerobaculia bacterium]